MGEKVLVTGGYGFIGSHVVDKLVELGYGVIIVDNLFRGRKENVNTKNVRFFKCSILDTGFADIVIKTKPDYIIHLAGQVSVSKSIKSALLDEEINIKGSINVIESAIMAKTKKIIYASSAAVYGSPLYLPIDTEHPISPQFPYGVSKYTVEKYLEMYSNLYGLNYTVLRYSNVFGPRQDTEGEGGVISIFIDKILKNKKVVITGDGEQTRDFIYVEDVVKANIQALTLGNKKVLNVSTGKAVTINELYEAFLNICGITDEPEYVVERIGDIKHSVLKNEVTKMELEWEPTMPLKRGLLETYRYYSSR